MPGIKDEMMREADKLERTVSRESLSDDLKAMLVFRRSKASLYVSSSPGWGLKHSLMKIDVTI